MVPILLPLPLVARYASLCTFTRILVSERIGISPVGIRERTEKCLIIGVQSKIPNQRCLLAVDLPTGKVSPAGKTSCWRCESAGLREVECVVSDDHAGLKKAIQEMLPEAAWQRCYVHFLRNALDYLPRKADDDCLMELRWMYDRRTLDEARRVGSHRRTLPRHWAEGVCLRPCRVCGEQEPIVRPVVNGLI